MNDRKRSGEANLSEIAELRREVSSLRESRKILEDTRRIARLGSWELDLRTDKMSWTGEVYNLAEVPPDFEPDLPKALGFFSPNHAEVLRKALQQAAESGTPFDLELRAVTAKGNDLWVRVMAEALEKDGDRLKLPGIIQDITDRKNAEEALRRVRDELEERVKDRTAELRKANEQLLREIAERKRAQQVLLESEERYRAIFENAQDSIYIKNTESEYTHVNPAIVKLLGVPAEELIGRTDQEIFGEEEGERTRRIDLRVLGGEAVIEEEPKLIRGRRITFHAIKVPIRDGSGKVTGICGIARDLSDRMKAEKALRKNERLLNRILSASPIGIGYVEESTLKWSNQAMAVMFGYDRQEDNLGRNIRDFYASEEEFESIRKKFAEPLRRGEPAEAVARLKRRDGSVYYGHVKTSALYPSDPGRATITTIADISEKMRAEQALRENEEKYRTIIENIEEGYYEVDKAGSMVFFNDSMCRILGYSRDEFIGMNYREYIDRANEDALARTFNTVFRTGGPAKILEWELIRKDGSRTTVESSVSPIRDTAGEIVGFRGICRDIAERKRAEQEFLKAQKLESLELVAGGIAHDFNNLLTGTIANISLARLLSDSDDRVLDALRNAEVAAEHAKDLTRQLLTFAKGGSPVIRSTSLAELLRESAGLVLSGSNLRCEFHIAEDLRPAQVDQLQISQVAQNVLINAQQAMPDGGAITVRADNVTIAKEDAEGLVGLREGDYVKLSFEDDGPGISPENLPRIFDPYFTTKPKGSGLGLSTAHSIIKRHSGYMEVESRPGEGTTFTVYLPASEHLVESEVHDGGAPALGAGRILLMDDEPMIRQVAGELLELLGYHVACAADGERAVELYRKAMEAGTRFDAVIMDLTVPGGLGGKAALERLLKLDPEVSAIVSSGHSADPVMSRHAEFGFKGVVAKPYNATELSRVLHDVICDRGG
jgi:PAS domain S-box-containing protein